MLLLVCGFNVAAAAAAAMASICVAQSRYLRATCLKRLKLQIPVGEFWSILAKLNSNHIMCF